MSEGGSEGVSVRVSEGGSEGVSEREEREGCLHVLCSHAFAA